MGLVNKDGDLVQGPDCSKMVFSVEVGGPSALVVDLVEEDGNPSRVD